MIPVTTTLLESIEPLSDGEREELAEFRREHAKKWAKKTMLSLLDYADFDQEFAETLCRDVADKFGLDDKLSALLLKLINSDRVNKGRGRHKAWTIERYKRLLLRAYIHGLDVNELVARKILAEREGYSGKNGSSIIKARIDEALQTVSTDELPDFLHPFIKTIRGTKSS